MLLVMGDVCRALRCLALSLAAAAVPGSAWAQLAPIEDRDFASATSCISLALGLARPELREHRLTWLELLQTARMLLEAAQEQRLPFPELLIHIERMHEVLRNCTGDDADEYASMARAFLAG